MVVVCVCARERINCDASLKIYVLYLVYIIILLHISLKTQSVVEEITVFRATHFLLFTSLLSLFL